MNESRKTVDARGQACPGPVILVKKALEEGGFDLLEVLVDNPAARENVLRFAEYSGRAAKEVRGEAPSISILIPGRPVGKPPAAGEAGKAGTPGPIPAPARDAPGEGSAGLTVLLASDRVGRGDDGLGALLMRGFLYALAESDDPPSRIILMNHGVRLAAEGSESLANLKRLEGSGVELLVCGTCLDYLGLKESLSAGRVSNMYEIAELLSAGRVLSV